MVCLSPGKRRGSRLQAGLGADLQALLEWLWPWGGQKSGLKWKKPRMAIPALSPL